MVVSVQACICVDFEVYCYQIFTGAAAMNAAEIENTLHIAVMALELENCTSTCIA